MQKENNGDLEKRKVDKMNYEETEEETITNVEQSKSQKKAA
jgi:hypothetical protein